MLTCIRSKRQRNAAEYALRTIQSSCIRPYIKTIYLYGSCARGEEKYSSDVDLFLELSESFRSRPELKKVSLSSKIRSILMRNLDDAETDLKIVVGDDWKRKQNAVLYKCAKGRNSRYGLEQLFDLQKRFSIFKASYDAGIVAIMMVPCTGICEKLV